MVKIKISARIPQNSPLFNEENMSEVVRKALEMYYALKTYKNLKGVEEFERTHYKGV